MYSKWQRCNVYNTCIRIHFGIGVYFIYQIFEQEMSINVKLLWEINSSLSPFSICLQLRVYNYISYVYRFDNSSSFTIIEAINLIIGFVASPAKIDIIANKVTRSDRESLIFKWDLHRSKCLVTLVPWDQGRLFTNNEGINLCYYIV